MADADEKEILQISELTRQQRRVLGVLIEKAYTTPEYYPLTVKATTTGSNQKSNRSPVMSLEEDEVVDILDQLRAIGLVAEVHTDGGRAPRYRHYMRHKLDFTEPQLAIMTELLLRGIQQLGELRSRASRMVQIASQADLKTELKGLLADGYIQADGPIDRRGIQVDHNWYRDKENKTLSGGGSASPAETADETSSEDEDSASSAPVTPQTAPVESASEPSDVAKLKEENALMMDEMKSLQDEIQSLRGEFQQLNGHFNDLRQQLGG